MTTREMTASSYSDDFARTQATPVDALASFNISAADHRAEWDDFIDNNLIEWARDSSCLEDEGIIVPSREVLDLSIRLAMNMRDVGWKPPDRIVPSGDGGIVFEQITGPVSVSIEVLPDCHVELLAFEDSELFARQVIL